MLVTNAQSIEERLGEVYVYITLDKGVQSMEGRLEILYFYITPTRIYAVDDVIEL